MRAEIERTNGWLPPLHRSDDEVSERTEWVSVQEIS